MSTMSVECYIEEYQTPRGLAARLRETGTDRKVSIAATSVAQKAQFLKFLNAAGLVFKRFNRSDPIIVSGRVDKESSFEIRFLHDEQLRCRIA